MSQREKMKADFVKLLDGYYMQFVYLKDLIDVQEDIDNHMEELKDAPNFALIAECGLIDSYMIAFAKLFDKSEKTATIFYLLDSCEENSNLFDDADAVRRKMEEYKLIIENDKEMLQGIEIVRKRRDTMLVHNDRKYFGENMEKDTSYLRKYILWKMRDFVGEVLDYISIQLGVKSKHSITKYNGDLKKLLCYSEHV